MKLLPICSEEFYYSPDFLWSEVLGCSPTDKTWNEFLEVRDSVWTDKSESVNGKIPYKYFKLAYEIYESGLYQALKEA